MNGEPVTDGVVRPGDRIELGGAATLFFTDKRFDDAHRLYERFGARVEAERVHDDPDSSHEWGLVLEL